MSNSMIFDTRGFTGTNVVPTIRENLSKSSWKFRRDRNSRLTSFRLLLQLLVDAAVTKRLSAAPRLPDTLLKNNLTTPVSVSYDIILCRKIRFDS